MKASTCLLVFDLVLVACGSPSHGDVPAPDASIEIDAPLAPSCGNGALEAGEVCDPGIATACTDLGATWSGGAASCAADCTHWDVSACTRASTDSWETVEPATRDPQWATARCNDGTPFDFDIRLAAQPTKTWVIQLDGGGFCDDVSKPCSARDVGLTTSGPHADRALSTTITQGVTSRNATVNPTFATANHVNATYCSSDLWAGATTDRRPSSYDPVHGWYYSGHINVTAMMAVLKQRYGLDDSDVDLQVLWTGSSAGALGAHLNASIVEAALPATVTRKHVRMLVDAGWFADWVDPDPAPPTYYIGVATVADAELWKEARAFWGATFDPQCEAATSEPSRCLFGAVWYPFESARMPILIQQSTLDAQFAVNHGIDVSTSNPTRDAWQTTVKTSQLGVNWLFAGDTSYHTLAMTTSGMLTGPTGNRLVDVLGRFWHDATPQRVAF